MASEYDVSQFLSNDSDKEKEQEQSINDSDVKMMEKEKDTGDNHKDHNDEKNDQEDFATPSDLKKLKTNDHDKDSGDDVPIYVKYHKLHPDAHVPVYSSIGAACFDLKACENVTLEAGKNAAVNTGIGVEFVRLGKHIGKINIKYFMFIKDRSGLAVKQGITTMAGVIDEDYRGPIKVVLHNTSSDNFEIKVGDRIAQAYVSYHRVAQFVEADNLSETERGENGFGSTGV